MNRKRKKFNKVFTGFIWKEELKKWKYGENVMLPDRRPDGDDSNILVRITIKEI